MMDDIRNQPSTRRRDTNDSRAERKRELDRLAQRATRERTKNRIAFLEQKLASLEAGDKQGEIGNLTRIIDALRNDNTRLQSTMMKMRFAIGEALGDAEAQAGGTIQTCGCPATTNCNCRNNSVHSQTPTFDSARHDSISSDGSDAVIEMPLVQPMPQADVMTTMNMNGMEGMFDPSSIPMLDLFEFPALGNFPQWNATMPSPFDYRIPAFDAPKGVARDVEKWHVSNNAFIDCLKSVKAANATNAVLDLGVPVKAAVWGWDSVGPEAQHPVWAALRQVDQKVFGTWTSKAQRIALMYVCQTLIQWREEPTQENLDRVPIWFRPRPAQEKVQHPAVIDFLVWPGLRDRLVFEHEKYTATGDFSAAFVNCFDFHWPYPDKDMFAYSATMDRFEISKVFLEYAYNFHNWTMKPEFFKMFPEMQHDIAATPEMTPFAKAQWTG